MARLSKTVRVLRDGRFCIAGEDGKAHMAYVRAGEVVRTTTRSAEEYHKRGKAEETKEEPTLLYTEYYEDGMTEEEKGAIDLEDENELRRSCGLPPRAATVDEYELLRYNCGLRKDDPRILVETEEDQALADKHNRANRIAFENGRRILTRD